MSSIHEGFQDAGQMAEVETLFRWLDGADALPPIQEIKHRMLEVCSPHEGERVLDVGCGVGHEVMRLAQRVGSSGRVVGIDKSEIMIAEARRRASGASLPVEFAVGDACRLDVPDNAFDLCRTERVLRYVDEPE